MYLLTRLILWALVAYFVYLIWRFISRRPRPKTGPTPQAKRLPQMMVKDETCNTYLPMEEALKEIFQGKEYYFCSQECRRKFLEQKKNSA